MAAATASASTRKRHNLTNIRLTSGVITISGDYATGGVALSMKSLGLLNAESVIIAPTAGYAFEYDRTNKKVLIYSGALAQVANATTLPTLTPQYIAIGN